MLVRIPVDQLKLGMYIHEFCGSWFDHPFWRNAFLLDDPEDLRDIQQIGFHEVWIDTSKGVGVEGGKSEKMVAAEVDETLARANADRIIARHAEFDRELRHSTAHPVDTSVPSRPAGVTHEAARPVDTAAQPRPAGVAHETAHFIDTSIQSRPAGAVHETTHFVDISPQPRPVGVVPEAARSVDAAAQPRPAGVAHETAHSIDASIQSRQAVQEAAHPAETPVQAKPVAPEPVRHIEYYAKSKQQAAIAREAEHSVKIFSQSKQAVSDMFHEARMGKALHAHDALPIVEEITSSVIRNPGTFISLARLKDKDNYTYMHSVAVCALMVSLARQFQLSMPQIHQAGLAGLMHDIGKTVIPLEIINKPGKLTEAEFQVIRSHPTEGYRILRESTGMSDVVLHVCLHHHEKVDGSGYPGKFTNEQIGLYAKMAAICDVYDAITTTRSYKHEWEPGEAVRKMTEWSQQHFDQHIFFAFIKSIGIYPVGTLVRLASDRLGVVVEQSDVSLLTPVLSVFYSTKDKQLITPELLDLSKPNCRDKIVSHEDPEKWGIHNIREQWSGVAAVAG